MTDDTVDRDAILRRRAMLVAAAVAGLSACGGRDEPPPEPCLSITQPLEPCLSPMPDPPDAGPPASRDAGAHGGLVVPESTAPPPPAVCLSPPLPPKTP